MSKNKIVFTRHSVFESAMIGLAIFEPATAIPQIIQIYTSKNASSLSLLSQLLYLGTTCMWLFYGIRTKSRPLALTSLLWMISELLIIFGIFLYA